MVKRIMIMAGGTGGHVFPALAVAERLREQGVEIVWLGTRSGLEAELVPRAGIDIEWISITGLRGKNIITLLWAPVRLAGALVQTLLIFFRRRPMAVLGMGGFVAGPGGLMAWLLHRPLLIHEQNAVAGLTNRLLARLADRVMEAFPAALPARYRPLVTGNPVRREICQLAEPRDRYNERHGPLRLLVLGGSLGATALNSVVVSMLQILPRDFRVEVWHQTGSRHLDAVQQAYNSINYKETVRVEPFIEDMAAAYAWADIVLCRAGALTVAEVAAAGVAAIFVPYPHAVDDHQSANAGYLAQAGAAIVIAQSELVAEKLMLVLRGCWQDHQPATATDNSGPRQQLCQMACIARSMAAPDAAEKVANVCLEVMND